jgi:hypothetical protein
MIHGSNLVTVAVDRRHRVLWMSSAYRRSTAPRWWRRMLNQSIRVRTAANVAQWDRVSWLANAAAKQPPVVLQLSVNLSQMMCFSANSRIASAGISATETVASIITANDFGCASVEAIIRPEREVSPLFLTAT